MLKIYPDTKIYVHCPAGKTTGGVELLHQLVSFLRDNNKLSYVVYYGEQPHNIPDDYSIYNIYSSENVEDNPHNIEVYTESMCKALSENNRTTQKFIWWLSIDNYYICTAKDLPLSDIFSWNKRMGIIFLLHRIKHFILGENLFSNKISLFNKKYLDYACGYQCEYIHDFLQKKGYTQLLPLKDYINEDYSSEMITKNRQDIVLYNPSKGMEFTQKLINKAPNIKWLPLCGMTRKQMITTIQNAKLYIDFGSHPGKDRLPRECAMAGCCIITGKRGAARYFEDVPIDERYKLDEETSSISTIIRQIEWTLANYETAINDFSYYRNIISMDKSEFERQVMCAFNINRNSNISH